MSRAEWRVPGAYETLRSLDASGFAWEYLRRNQDFLRERRKLLKDDSRGILDIGEAQRFSRRWGVRFREHGPPGEKEPDCLGPPCSTKRYRHHIIASGIL
jgi:hypothetical protein